ncbi:MAG: hypothetical protein KAG53_08765 [Endozoicomonadaceae bacterium]|nr:hypothetical protein [Endozoicomonadaceae bacterium]
MGVILEFPGSNTKKTDIVDKFVRKIGEKTGLSKEEIASVLNSYRSVHPYLTNKFESQMEIPVHTNLDKQQIDIINEALAEHMSDLFACSASIIIGLLAREQVNNRKL